MTVHSQGIVTPLTETELSSPVSGRVVSVNPRLHAGGFFRKGEQLLEIEKTRYKAVLASSGAAVARARLELQKIEASAKQAEQDWQKLGSGKASSLALYKPQLEEARATLEAEKAAYQVAQRDLADTSVVAPYDCRVRSVAASLGSYLDGGEPIATVFSIDAAEVRLPVGSEDLSYLDVDVWGEALSTARPLEVALTAYIRGQQLRWGGRIIRSEGTIDPTNRQTYLVARIDDPYDRLGSGNPVLPAGQHVQAEIRGRNIDGVVKLPALALVDKNSVMVVDDDDRIRRKGVHTLAHMGDDVLIDGGLEKGDRVCIGGLNMYVEGQKVNVSKEALLAGTANEHVQ
jgi:RND family efflux transporter MFP subunit